MLKSLPTSMVQNPRATDYTDTYRLILDRKSCKKSDKALQAFKIFRSTIFTFDSI